MKIDAPGAKACQQTEFGDATDYSTFAGEHFSLAAGADLGPLLKGLDGDLCQSPHWGYIIGGELTVNYGDGSEEKAMAGDLIYWPPGHTIKAEQDSEFVLFSPQHEHTPVMDHVRRQMM